MKTSQRTGKTSETIYLQQLNQWMRTNKQYIDQLGESELSNWKQEYQRYQKYKQKYHQDERKRILQQVDTSQTIQQRQPI